MSILPRKKNKGTTLWWHGRRKEASREREKRRKEGLLSTFMILSIQKNAMSNKVVF